MGSDYKFCGRPVSQGDLDLICEVITDFGLPRTEIAATLCEWLDWKRPTGKLKTVECLQFLVKLEAEGLIKLPPVKNQHSRGRRVAKRTKAGENQEPVRGSLKDLGRVQLIAVTDQRQRDLWKELIDRYHYLGYKVPFGASLRYLVTEGDQDGRLLGCLQFSSPAWKVAARDEWIGWDQATRAHRLQLIVQNSRFLLMPWVEVKQLASHVLGKAARRIGADWESSFGVKPCLLETYVEQARFKGTCYRAANWECVGQTMGRGRMDRDKLKDEPIKTVWVYPLVRQAKRRLCAITS